MLSHHFKSVPIYPGFAFEGLANRNSMKYVKLYGLDENTLTTMFRGTLRYKVLFKLYLALYILVTANLYAFTGICKVDEQL